MWNCLFSPKTGGIFTRTCGNKQFGLRRDKDIPQILTRCRDVYALGFLGNDTYEELEGDVQAKLGFRPMIDTQARFALATLQPRRAEIGTRINDGEPLVVATSYPARSQRIAQRLGFSIKELVVFGGSVEASLQDDPSVDVIVDIVSSGNTLRDNNLEIVIDELGGVTLGAVWQK